MSTPQTSPLFATQRIARPNAFVERDLTATSKARRGLRSAVFGPKECKIRDAKKRVESSRAFVQRGDTRADGQANNVSLHRMRGRFDCSTDALGQPKRRPELLCSGGEGYKFFAANAGE